MRRISLRTLRKTPRILTRRILLVALALFLTLSNETAFAFSVFTTPPWNDSDSNNWRTKNNALFTGSKYTETCSAGGGSAATGAATPLTSTSTATGTGSGTGSVISGTPSNNGPKVTPSDADVLANLKLPGPPSNTASVIMTTTYGGQWTGSGFSADSKDDNGIGYFNDATLKQTYSYANLNMGTAMGSIPGFSRLKITNPFNGKAVIAENLDIGAGASSVDGMRPYMDVWYQTAEALGYTGGSMPMYVEFVPQTTPLGPTTASTVPPEALATIPNQGIYKGGSSSGSGSATPLSTTSTAGAGGAAGSSAACCPASGSGVVGGGGGVGGTAYPTVTDEVAFANAIDAWIEKSAPNSPMKGLGKYAVQGGKRANINPIIPIMIARMESQLGSDTSTVLGPFPNSHNAYGFNPDAGFSLSQVNSQGAVTWSGRPWVSWSSFQESLFSTGNPPDMYQQLAARPDINKGATVGAFISEYAPSFENNTAEYIANMDKWAGEIYQLAGAAVTPSKTVQTPAAVMQPKPSILAFTPSHTTQTPAVLGAMANFSNTGQAGLAGLTKLLSPTYTLRNGGSWGDQNIATGTFDGTPTVQIHYPANSASPSVHDIDPNAYPIGGAQGYYTFADGKKLDVADLSYRVYFPAGFDFIKGGKLPGLYGGSQTSGGNIGSEGFSTRLMWRAGGDGELYLYAVKGPSIGQGTGKGISVGKGSFKLTPGKWITISEHVELNTPGQANGKFTLTVDGNKAIDVSDITYRLDASLQIEGLYFATFFGGDDPTWRTLTDQYSYFSGFSTTANAIALSATTANCAGSGASAGGPVSADVQGLINLVQQYAWVKGTDAQAGTGAQKPKYAQDVAAAQAKGWHVGGSSVPGNDCQGFVNVAMRTSGYEPNWPNVTTAELAASVQKLPGWTQVPHSSSIDSSTTDLQPGDVVMTSGQGHVLLYIGQVPWTTSRFVEAAYHDTDAGRAPYTNITAASNYSSVGGYVVFRKATTTSTSATTTPSGAL